MSQKQTPKGRIGGLLDDFLKEDGIYEQVQAGALKKVVAYQLAAAMKEQKLTKVAMAKRMNTSRSQLDRLLDPANDSMSLEALARAASAVGREVRLELV
jgi:antitoxin HicB